MSSEQHYEAIYHIGGWGWRNPSEKVGHLRGRSKFEAECGRTIEWRSYEENGYAMRGECKPCRKKRNAKR